MNPERFRQVYELYHAALDRQPGERAELLAQVDPELRREVESLLEQQGGGLLDRPAWEGVANLLSDPTRTQLSPGTQLGPYRIEAPLGVGGMGQVYRAQDTRLGRAVAIKICWKEFSGRFEREARAISALNHPHICTLYDVGPDYLVMELVEGPTLAERIARGAIPLALALDIARQVGEALEVAHEKGIIHRDLKPANVKLAAGEKVKVLDFGLAKMFETSTLSGDLENSPTHTDPLSRAGVILGTAAYMSPEQARGEEVDKRTDIWAFGVLLYEMLTGKRLFEGETTTEVLSAVLTKEPHWERVPAQVRRLLRSCLEKNPRRRLRDVGDAWRLLEDPPQAVPASWNRLRWTVAVLATIAAFALGFAYLRHAPADVRVLKFSVPPPEKAAFSRASLPAVSPDGHHLAFVVTADGKDSLWVRDLDTQAAHPLPGTDGATSIFWSPDSRFLAFWVPITDSNGYALLGGTLKKIDVAGGPPLTLCAVQYINGGSWSKNDVIILGSDQNHGVSRVPAAGGTATPVTAPDQTLGETSHGFPWFLPDGRHFLYTALNREPGKTAVYVGDLDSKARRKVLGAPSNAVYAPPGYLLFLREGNLMAQPFDAGKTMTTGDPFLIAEQVEYIRQAACGLFSSSQNGILAYAPGGAADNQQLTWFDRSGKAVGTVGTPGVMHGPKISPDGTTVAVDRLDPQTGLRDLWLHDLARGTASRFTLNYGGDNCFPVWSPDGRHIAFGSDRNGSGKLYQKATSGAARDEVLDNAARISNVPVDWSRDGRYIIEIIYDPNTKFDLWVLPLFGDHKPFPYLQTEFNEGDGRLSPNGRWLAYQSDETNRPEIYVQAFPAAGGKVQVSISGGWGPVWSRDGKELFFIGAERRLMAVEVQAGIKFQASLPKPLFETLCDIEGSFDVGKDGRFLIPTPETSLPVTVVVNWAAGLKR